jgi:pimeloyl-ACP methyl ester carboxylesterase
MSLKRVGVWVAVALAAVVAVPVGFRAWAAWRESAEVSELAPATGRLVPTRSGRIFVQEAGPADGVPVLMFHGTAAWSELWRDTMSALADAGFHAIALDLPPFGFSDRPADHSYTRADQAVRAHDVLDRLGVDTVVILGHSFGAGAAVETTLRYPQRIRGLVLVDAALGLMDGAASSAPAVLRHRWLREILVSATVTNPLLTPTLLRMLIARKDRATAAYVDILQRPMRLRNSTRDIGDWLVYFTSTDDGAASADRRAYVTISARTALIWGEKDSITPMAQADDLHALVPGSTLTILPDVGHIPQIEDPPTFHRVLIEQLRMLGANDPPGAPQTSR